MFLVHANPILCNMRSPTYRYVALRYLRKQHMRYISRTHSIRTPGKVNEFALRCTYGGTLRYAMGAALRSRAPFYHITICQYGNVIAAYAAAAFRINTEKGYIDMCICQYPHNPNSYRRTAPEQTPKGAYSDLMF